MLTRNQWIIVIILGIIAIFAYDFTNRQIKNESSNVAQAAASAPIEASAWKLYRPQNGRFEVLFPSLPQHVAESHPSELGKDFTKYDVYLAQERDGSVYMISMTRYPTKGDPGSSEEILEGVMNGAVKANPNNKLVHSERSTTLNLPSIDFAIQSQDYAIKTKAILDDKSLFVLTVMDRDQSRVDSDFNTFASSFVIKNDAPVETAPNTAPSEDTKQLK